MSRDRIDPERYFISSTSNSVRPTLRSFDTAMSKASASSFSSGQRALSSSSASAPPSGGLGKAADGAKGLFKSPFMVTALPFINGGLSGMIATAVIQPIDMVKVSHMWSFLMISPAESHCLSTTHTAHAHSFCDPGQNPTCLFIRTTYQPHRHCPFDEVYRSIYRSLSWLVETSRLYYGQDWIL